MVTLANKSIKSVTLCNTKLYDGASMSLSPFLKLSPTSIGIDNTGKGLLAFRALDDMVDNIINPLVFDLMMAKGTSAID